MVDEQPASAPRGGSEASAYRFVRRRHVIALVAVGILAVVLAWALLPLRGAHGPMRQVQWQQNGKGRCSVQEGRNKAFSFDGFGDRVFVPDAPEFHFGADEDFSVAAWIKAYPAPSRFAQRLGAWITAHPAAARLVPRRLDAWIRIHSLDNDFGVMPIVDKHQTPDIVSAVGFLFYLDSGRLGCMLSDSLAAEHRAIFVSTGPNLLDGHWHHIALTLERTSVTGGKLYVDGQQVFVFDPTGQAGDLSNSEPLRIGNHANPNLKCFFKGTIAGVTFDRRALTADEIAASHRAGRP
jgi:hypothetical protein